MPRATDEQVQQYADSRIRPHSEAIRSLLAKMNDDKVAIADVYEHCNNNPTWEDQRTDGPPHLLTPLDVLSFNAFITDIIGHIEAHPNLPQILAACVQPPQN